ncbi:3-phosphoshikimate 1-carboxyvinyltransferase chloroplastic-like [Trifolium pratense]|uniref:3-phosphoshikimate 1-carboxyvinyltransferase chloroplastic-like n=1 Tax=Trifolium pratense TaxID=57577 RepID=A0A2K3PK94_TRIPR|nr:3-phosphoshikimate 1-carboxyvinyltransferase chloroplastic-like [Trifolium pratense]
MLEALKTLGLRVEDDKTTKQAVVEGSGGLFPTGRKSNDEVNLFLGNAGTAMRPLTAALVAAGGNTRYILDGVPRMRERPIGDLVSGLKQLGADVDCFLGTNCPPVRIIGKGGLPGGKVKLSGSISSQYLTALLMAAPLALGDVEIEIVDKLISVPYVEMTLKLMERFGVFVEHSANWDKFLVHGGEGGPSSPEFRASSGIKWFQSPPKCSCGISNRGPPYQVQRQSPLNQLTFGSREYI